ncbi:TPA: hypothetical protein MDW71_005280 [Klebsiella pneumoniae]|nr:hypothetical protein [Klebsiella pneumoniae]
MKKCLPLLEVIILASWISVAVYSIGTGIKKLFSDNSFSLGGEEVISVLDSKPIAIMYILCGVIILIFLWVGYKRNREENDQKQK